MKKEIHTPFGMRDVYGQELKNKRKLISNIFRIYEKYGYQEIETTSIEFFDVFGSDIGTTPSNELYKFFDREGNTLVLRPDFTPSVARSVSMFFENEARPLRLCYEGSTFINHSEFSGRLNESSQTGVELIGSNTVEADAEIIALTAEAILASGIEEFQISIGEVGFFKALIKKAELSENEAEDIRSYITRKNFFGMEEKLSSYDMSPAVRDALIKLPQLFGGPDILKEAAACAVSGGEKQSIDRLGSIYAEIEKKGLEKYISFDFGSLSKYNYYTGIVFQAFTYGSGIPVAKGGRYDELLSHFGNPEGAVGVGLYVNQLLGALKRQDR